MMPPADNLDLPLIERMQGSCESLRVVIESLNGPELRRRELAMQLGGILKGLEAACYPQIGDAHGRTSGANAPGGAELSPMMQLALSEPKPPAADSRRVGVLSKFSAEQREAAKQAESHGELKVEARPGTGKTTFLIGVAETLRGRGTYVAYNRDVQRDASERFPRNVLTRTGHALAFAAVAGAYTSRKKPIRDFRQAEVIQLLGLQGESAGSVAYAASATLSSFLTTLDAVVVPAHVPASIRVRINRRLRQAGKTPEDTLVEVDRRCASIARHAQQLWEIAREESSRGALPHDGYLKLWLERKARIETDYLLIDEFQDVTPVMKAIFDLQSCRKIYVGDRHQAIYGFRGAINAMETLHAPTAYLTHSFRFGKNIAKAGNWVLDLLGEEHKIKGAAVIPGKIGPLDRSKPYTILARSNAALCVRAAEMSGKAKTAVVGGADEMASLMQSALGLYTGQRHLVKHPLLTPFETFVALRDYAEASADKECGMVVRMLDDHGGALAGIIQSLSTGLVAEADAHVILSTGHKSKGREWSQVQLEDDFPDLHDSNHKLRIDEANLLYVSATRAKVVLQPNARLLSLDSSTVKAPATASSDLNMARRVRAA